MSGAFRGAFSVAAPVPGDAPAIEAHNLSAQLAGVEVLHGLNLRLPRGRWTSIVGPNGAGKSTLLRCLAGLLPHDGQVSLLGRPLPAWPRRQRAQQLAWLGQAQGQGEMGADDLTVWDVVMLGRLPHLRWLAAPGPADSAAVERALAATHTSAWRTRPLGQLSGGERQRVLLARALAVQSQVLLMDEPLANLDPPHQADWLAAVRALVREGCTVVSVLHELGMALQADEMVVLEGGRIAHHGACASPATHQALQQVFDQRIAIHSVQGQWVALPRVAS